MQQVKQLLGDQGITVESYADFVRTGEITKGNNDPRTWYSIRQMWGPASTPDSALDPRAQKPQVEFRQRLRAAGFWQDEAWKHALFRFVGGELGLYSTLFDRLTYQ